MRRCGTGDARRRKVLPHADDNQGSVVIVLSHIVHIVMRLTERAVDGATKLSSRPERSGVEGPVVFPVS